MENIKMTKSEKKNLVIVSFLLVNLFWNYSFLAFRFPEWIDNKLTDLFPKIWSHVDALLGFIYVFSGPIFIGLGIYNLFKKGHSRFLGLLLLLLGIIHSFIIVFAVGKEL